MSGEVRVFQIYYDAATREALDPGFEPLDNSANERPDWFEYWPMRNYFLRQSLDADSYYGFFSPLFHSKTGLRGSQVKAFVEQAAGADVVTFSPHPCHAAVFYNVFEQGNNTISGLLDAARLFLREFDPGIRLEQVVNDSRNTVFCNYFVAKAVFWDAWNRVFRRMFELAETSRSPLHAALNRPVTYTKTDGDSKPVQMKVMVMERMASLLLALGDFKVRNYPPFELPVSDAFVGRLPELMELDRLKIAYAQTGDAQCLRQFVERRDRLTGVVWFGKQG